MSQILYADDTSPFGLRGHLFHQRDPERGHGHNSSEAAAVEAGLEVSYLEQELCDFVSQIDNSLPIGKGDERH